MGLFPGVLSMLDGGSEDTNRRSEPLDLDLLVSLVVSGACLSSKQERVVL